MHDVFISYSHKDAAIADAVCHKFEEAGIRCWYAPRNIGPGQEWADAIIKAIEDTKIVLLVFTDYSNGSTQVIREIDTALSAGKTIIPFKCAESNPTGSMRYYLSTLHWMDALSADMNSSINSLLEYTIALLGMNPGTTPMHSSVTEQPAAPKPAAPKPAAEPKKKPKALPFIIAGAAVLAAAVIAVVLIIILNAPKAQTEPAAAPAQPTSDIENSGLLPTENIGYASKSGDLTESTESAEVTENNVSDVPDTGEGQEDNYLYTVVFNTVRLDKYLGPENAVMVIPSTIEGKPVTKIGEKCFEDHKYIEKLVLPEGLEKIDYRAFYGCEKLSEFNIPSTLKSLGGWSFAHCGLTKVIFPETFTDLGYGSFYSNGSLNEVVLSSSVDKLGADTFRRTGKGLRVTMPAKSIEIDSKAFDSNSGAVLIAPKGSYAEKYAAGMGLTYEEYKQ